MTAGPDHPLRVETAADGTPAPYILVRPGLEARLARPVFYELVDLGHEEVIDGETQFGVWSGGVFFRLGDPGEDDGRIARLVNCGERLAAAAGSYDIVGASS